MFEILDDCDTPFGRLTLRRRELLSRQGTIITEVTIDHVMLMSSHHTVSERALVEEALALHTGHDLRVLIGGLGLGYTAHEALASDRIATVDVVELVPQVIAWTREGKIPLAEALNAASALVLHQGSIFDGLAAAPDRSFDLILIDVDHAPDDLLHPVSRRFYTQDGLRAARRHLADHGVLALWSTAGNDEFARDLEAVFSRTQRRVIRWWNDLIDEEKEDVLFLAVR